MTLLFAIAGISSKYAIQKRKNKQFVSDRIRKLLIPFVFGVLVLVPIMTYVAEIYFDGYSGTYFQQYVLFFTKETDLTGYKGGFTPAHLWFPLFLFIISVVSLLIIEVQKKNIPNLCIENISYLGLVLLFVPDWLFLYVFNIGGKSIGQFLILYLFGFYILCQEKVLQKIKDYRYVSVFLWVTSGCIYTYLYCFENMRNELGTGLFVFFGWTGIISLLGIGQTTLNFHNKLSDYLNCASFPIYIIHLPVLVVVGFIVLKIQISVVRQFVLIILLSFFLTLLLYEMVKRIPFIKILFGIRK